MMLPELRILAAPLIYASGAVTYRLCETGRLQLAALLFALSVGMCSMLVTSMEE